MEEPSAYWSRIAREKTFTHPLRTELLRTHVPLDTPLLDLGCGYGRLAAELLAAGWQQVVGADTAAGMIARGRAEHARRPELELVHLNGPRLPFADGAFGGALLFSVLTCVPDTDEELALLAELRRVLRPNGVLYVSDLLLQTDERNLRRYREAEEEELGVFTLPEGVRLRHYERDHVLELLADFELLHFEEIDVITMNGNGAHGFQALVRRGA